MRSSQHRHLGFCIFCGGAGETDDHVVPLALGGVDILRKSSCESCRDNLNKRVDAPVLNGNLLFPRMVFDRPRSKKRAPRTWGKVKSIPGGEGKMLEIERDFQTAPKRIFMVSTDKPCLLDQARPRRGDGGFTVKSISSYISPRSMISPDETEILFSTDELIQFYRMVAKIGLSAAYLLMGQDDFDPIIGGVLCDYGNPEIFDYVGCGKPLPVTEQPYQLSVRHDGRYVVASVQIFADLRMPTYDVVVGFASRMGSLFVTPCPGVRCPNFAPPARTPSPRGMLARV